MCLTDSDVEAIAAYLGMEEAEFVNTYCRLQRNRQGLSLIDAGDGACIMLSHNECRIQKVKPQQCRDFPERWSFPGWEKRCPGAAAQEGGSCSC